MPVIWLVVSHSSNPLKAIGLNAPRNAETLAAIGVGAVILLPVKTQAVLSE